MKMSMLYLLYLFFAYLLVHFYFSSIYNIKKTREDHWVYAYLLCLDLILLSTWTRGA